MSNEALSKRRSKSLVGSIEADILKGNKINPAYLRQRKQYWSAVDEQNRRL